MRDRGEDLLQRSAVLAAIRGVIDADAENNGERYVLERAADAVHDLEELKP